MKKLLSLIIVSIIGCFAVFADGRTDTYRVTRECPELGLYKGDQVKVTISDPSSYATPIYVVNPFKSEFNMESARSGMARVGSNGYSSQYMINGNRVNVHRTYNSITVSQGKYSFELELRR
ncbi:MAG: hypothetical protein K2M49_09120 [Muribaculaceae bacterium]|nr:hypothetical protein [Muribaculaceae bacterium]